MGDRDKITHAMAQDIRLNTQGEQENHSQPIRASHLEPKRTPTYGAA
jgi:hypothetical protein